jgi:hypothetical protein
MNYYAARQRQTDKKWDFTCRNDDYIRPVGYCDKYQEWWLDFHKWGFHVNEHEKQLYQAHEHQHHTDGHTTADEARECYRRYLLDQRVRLGMRFEQQSHCQVCGEWTDMYAEVDHTPFTLCKKHNTQKQLELLFKTPGEIWSS